MREREEVASKWERERETDRERDMERERGRSKRHTGQLWHTVSRPRAPRELTFLTVNTHITQNSHEPTLYMAGRPDLA